MPVLTFILVIVIVGASLVVKTNTENFPSSSPQASPVVMGDTTETSPTPSPTESPIATPRASTNATPRPIPTSTTTTGNSNISISVDDAPKNTETIVYPGASGGGNRYETSDSGERVYDWYKQELEKKSYNIRNNVKTRANEKFKAVLQAVSSQNSFKVSIDQESSNAKTIITFE